jgi:hypothetical protein
MEWLLDSAQVGLMMIRLMSKNCIRLHAVSSGFSSGSRLRQ